MGAHGEHHAVDIDQCFSQRCDIGQIALENFRARIEAGLQWIAYQRSYGIALSYGLVYGKSADTAGSSDNQYVCRFRHAISLMVAAIADVNVQCTQRDNKYGLSISQYVFYAYT